MLTRFCISGSFRRLASRPTRPSAARQIFCFSRSSTPWLRSDSRSWSACLGLGLGSGLGWGLGFSRAAGLPAPSRARLGPARAGPPSARCGRRAGCTPSGRRRPTRPSSRAAHRRRATRGPHRRVPRPVPSGRSGAGQRVRSRGSSARPRAPRWCARSPRSTGRCADAWSRPLRRKPGGRASCGRAGARRGSRCAVFTAPNCAVCARAERFQRMKIVKQVHRWVYRLTSLGHQHWVCTSLGRSAPLASSKTL
eukprot:scaffold84329_cov64-Phaeocystis_antarctica.AAC.2